MAKVYANKRSILYQKDGRKHIAPLDACKTSTPGGPVPIPYVNIAMNSDLSKGAKSTTIARSPVVIASSSLSKSSGDEPGTLGGLISNKNRGKLTWASSSSDVKVEGKGVVRFLDGTQHNGNSFNTALVADGKMTGWVWGDDAQCDLCEVPPAEHPKVVERSDLSKPRCEELAAELHEQYRRSMEGRKVLQEKANNLVARQRDLKAKAASPGEPYHKLMGMMKASRPMENKQIQRLIDLKETNEKIVENAARIKANQEKIEALPFRVSDGNSGYMIGILYCHETKTIFAACSGREHAGFIKIVTDNHDDWILCKGAPSPKTLHNGHGPLSPDNARKTEALWESLEGKKHPHGYEPGLCAAPKLIAEAQKRGHKPAFMTEQYFNPIKSPMTKDMIYKKHKNYQNFEDCTAKDLQDGESIPSCTTCQVLVPGMLCDTRTTCACVCP